MTITLSEFRRQAEKRGICSMSHEWDRCASNKQRIDLCLTIRGIKYTSRAIAEGWGISPDEILREFKPFLNGRYIHHDPVGYTSAIYCGTEGDVEVGVTAAMIVGCKGTIRATRLCELHIVKSDVKVMGEAKIYNYGSTIELCDE